MKKYITLAALLAAGSLAANAATIANATKAEANTKLNAAIADSSYNTTLSSWTLTFELAFSQNWGRFDLLDLNKNSPWTIASQEGKYIGLDNEANGIEGWINTGTHTTAYNESVKSNQEGWLFESTANNNVSGLLFTIKTDVKDGTSVTIKKGADLWATFDIVSIVDGISTPTSLNLGDIEFEQATKDAAVTIDGTFYAIPEPSAFGLLAGLGALALVGTRRRRK